MKPSLALATLLLLFVFVSCGDSAERAVVGVLDAREKAFETRDVSLYRSLIDPDYKVRRKGKVEGAEDVIRRFQGVMAFFDHISVDYSDRVVTIEGRRARVVQRAHVSVSMYEEGIKSSFKVREVLELRNVDGRWYISREAPRDLAEGFVFGDM